MHTSLKGSELANHDMSADMLEHGENIVQCSLNCLLVFDLMAITQIQEEKVQVQVIFLSNIVLLIFFFIIIF